MTIALEKVSRVVGLEHHIKDVSVTFERGSLNVLLGATLSGKTSLMRVLAGLDVPTTGRVLIDGQDVTGRAVQQRSVAMVYQQFINYPSMTVYENIAAPLRVRRLPATEIDQRVRAVAKLLRLEPYLERKPLQLSGGQQQRTALGRALVKRADLVLLDEPLANLDYKLREELREELPRIFSESGAIFVYATTEPTEALLLGGKLACLHEGRLLQYGPTSDVYRRPANRLTASVCSDPPLNVFDADVQDGSVSMLGAAPRPALGLLQRVRDGHYKIGVRAHHLTIGTADQSKYHFPATALLTEITGSESFVHLATGDARWMAVLPGVHDLPPDTALDISVDPQNCFIFDATDTLVAAPELR
jgi:glycerol transport system ATP-binding protein